MIRLWTEAEEALLLELRAQNTSKAVIAWRLGRSEQSIGRKSARLRQFGAPKHPCFWSEEKTALLIELWATDMPRAEIAQRLGRAEKTLYGHVRRLRAQGVIAPRGLVKRADNWLESRDEELKRLAKQGLTCSAIARCLNVTRNSVIGRRRRLGMGVSMEEIHRRRASAARKTHENKTRPRQGTKAKPNFIFGHSQRPIPITPPYISPDPAPANRVSFMARTDQQCAWTCDDGQMCGRPVHHHRGKSSSWCPDHFIRVFLIPKGRYAA